MTLHTLPHIEVNTGENPTACIIWLHGLGADGHDFETIVPQLGLPSDLAIRFIFPHAPSLPISINGGYIMPAWYDIKHNDLGHEQDASGIHHSAQLIQMLIDQQVMHGIKADRIILAGFSQGGAMALHIGLRQSEPLAGIMALSCYIPIDETLDRERNPATSTTPIFIAHGTDDAIVTIDRGQKAQQTLRSLGHQVTWHHYPMEHSVCPEEIAHIGQWVQKCLNY